MTGAPGAPVPRPGPLDRMVEFAGFLRARELDVDPGSLVEAARALDVLGTGSRRDARAAMRACLCRDARSFRRFDALFDAFWRPFGDEETADAVGDGPGSGAVAAVVAGQRLLGMAGTSEKAKSYEETFGAGDFKALSLADFRFVFDGAELRAIEALVDRMARRARRRATRRARPAPAGGRIDLRRSLRASLAHGGHLVEPRFRRPRRRLERFVLLLDVSQSMDVYARLFLRFARVVMTVFDESDAFAFNTDLLALGRGRRSLTEADLERVVNREAKGWLGGTRISASLERFEAEHGRRLLGPRTTLVVFSDGCDTAKPEALAATVERVARRAGRLVWVNPLLGRFEAGELDRYMDPVAVHVDEYVSAHNLRSLEGLERALLGTGRRRAR